MTLPFAFCPGFASDRSRQSWWTGDPRSEAALSPPEEPIVLQPSRTSQRRVIVPLLLCAGMLVIPLVALATSGTPGGTVRVAAKRGAAADAAPVSLAAMQPATEAPPATIAAEAPQVTVQAAAEVDATAATTLPPSPRVTAASAAPASRVTTAPTTAAPRPAPTSPPTTHAPSTTAAPQHSQSGPASYYDQAPNGTCAHPTLPFGTVVSIVDTDNGNTASCTVEDRGPYAGGRIIDLARDVFSRLAPVSQGVINVRISW